MRKVKVFLEVGLNFKFLDGRVCDSLRFIKVNLNYKKKI
jgi:hypothetical protein